MTVVERKREIEAKRRLLENPLRMKQLQETVGKEILVHLNGWIWSKVSWFLLDPKKLAATA